MTNTLSPASSMAPHTLVSGTRSVLVVVLEVILRRPSFALLNFRRILSPVYFFNNPRLSHDRLLLLNLFSLFYGASLGSLFFLSSSTYRGFFFPLSFGISLFLFGIL
jgi:hypothetical protein